MQQVASGTQTATINTEHTLQTITNPGVYQLNVDVHNLASGDLVQLRAKKKIVSAGSAREEWMYFWQDAQGEFDAAVLPPVAGTTQTVFTLKQTTGTGRIYDWSIWRIDL